MMMRARFLLLASLLPLAGCISGQPPVESYTDRVSGKEMVIESDSEQCKRSCNEDYSRCMDTMPAQSSGVNGPSYMFGANADCRNELQSCLPGCKSR